MAYTRGYSTWSNTSAGNTPITASKMQNIEDGIYKNSQVSDYTGQLVDTFPGSTDDEKFGNALSYAAAQTQPPPILFGNRQYDLTTQRAMFSGLTMLGVPGMNNMERGNAQGAWKTRINATGGGTFLQANSTLYDVTIRNFGFTGSQSTQFMGGTGINWCMNLRDCSWSSFNSILGNQSTKLLLNLCRLDGWLSFHNSYTGEIHIGGSDNNLFAGTTNIDSGTGYLSPGGSNGQYLLWFDYMEKTSVGPIYLTAEGGWSGIKVSGPTNLATSGGSNLGGPIWIHGAKIEGRNAGAPSNGSLIRVEGGQLNIRDSWLGYAMANPSATGRNDSGIVHQTGGTVLVKGVTYDRASSVAETTNFVYSSGGESHVGEITRGSKGGSWTGRPRVSGVTYYDSTVTNQ